MTHWQLYKLISRNAELKDTRHPMFEKNRFMKYLLYFMVAYYASLMILMGVTMPLGMRGTYPGVAAFHVLDGWAWVILVCDFWLRFAMQETPAQQVKQYSLLPVKRGFLMHLYLINAIRSSGNLFWGFLLVPFGIIAIVPMLGWGAFAGWMLGWWLLIVAGGMCYLLTRAACKKNIFWFIPMLLVHGAIVALALLPKHNLVDMPCTWMMYAFLQWKWYAYLAAIALIALFYWLNFIVQSRMLYNEVGNKEEVKVSDSKTAKLSFMDKYGVLGEYLKMEIRLRLRNKQVKMQFFVGLGAMLSLSLLLDLTEVYDNGFMTSFICLYDYIVLGMMTLVTIMEYEGNYLDGLMSRRESILQLLRAKYYFNSILLLIPIILVIPSIVIGKISIWMNLGYLFFTIGVLYPAFFQLAVYNKETIPLNQKLTGKQANAIQNIISIVVFFLPIGLEKLATLCLGDPWGYIFLMALGTIGFATHRMWIRNIYNRFMQRRYINMEGYRASRRA